MGRFFIVMACEARFAQKHDILGEVQVCDISETNFPLRKFCTEEKRRYRIFQASSQTYSHIKFFREQYEKENLRKVENYAL